MKTEGPTPKLDNMPSDFRLLPMGEADALRKQLSSYYPALDWSDPAWGFLEGNGFSIQFNFTKSGPVESFMLHVGGAGDAVSFIVDMCRHAGWQALDCSGDFLDLDNPCTEGWKGFQTLRDSVIGSRPKGGNSV
jgi:hypothetical protein